MSLTMIDVSGWTAPINWKALKGVQVVAAKCTEGTSYVNPEYAAQRAGAKSIGAAFVAYHFGHANISAAAQLAHFIGQARLGPGDIPALDFEVSDGLGISACASWGSAYAHGILGAYQVWPWAYSDRDFIEAGNFDGLRNCPIWVAELEASAPTVRAPIPLPGFTIVADQWSWVPPLDRDVCYTLTSRIGQPAVTQAQQLLAQLNAAEGALARIKQLLGKVVPGA